MSSEELEREVRARISEMEEEVRALKLSLQSAKHNSASSSSSSDSSEYGYVYILHADLRVLCCDYWLGASGGVLEPSIMHDFSDSADKVEVRSIPGDEDMSKIWKMFTYEPWPEGVPKPYTVRVPHSGKSNTDEYVSQVGRYLRAAAQHAYHPSRQPFRSTFRKSVCPLMASPLLGTGWGGNQKNTGEMALRLLPTLYDLANKLRIDVALVTNDREVYALMQWARNNMINNFSRRNGVERSPHYATVYGERYLGPTHIERINQLTAYALQGQLSLFVGAGASMGSNVPDWGGLVESLAEELGLTAERMKEFSKVDVYTKAAVLEAEVERRCEAEENVESLDDSKKSSKRPLCLGDYVARKLIHARYSVVHALLASLPVNEAITTNFDNLFEKAWRLHGDFAVLPHAPFRRRSKSRDQSAPKWLLKMHGCVATPEEIVLTKSHYIRYAERYAALAGIVQASLLTRHLLFVGFSFDDDNFQRIFDPVRKAKRLQEKREKETLADDALNSSAFARKEWRRMGDRNSEAEKVDACGTALLLQHSVLKEELWQGDICMTPMEQRSSSLSIPSLARKQEIFLDILASNCAVSLQMEFLMNQKFEKALSPSEVMLRDVVRQFEQKLKSLPQESKQNVAYVRIMNMLSSLGSDSAKFFY